MQRFNFQFTGQRFYRIEDGRLAGQVRDVAYQATTTDFWGSMEAVGGPRHLGPRRRLQLRQGPTRAGRGGEPRLPDVAVPRRPDPQHHAGGGPADDAPHALRQLVEHALATSRADDCIVIVRDGTQRQPALGQQHADHQRRHALPRRDRHRVVRGAGGVSSGSVSGSATTTDQVTALVEAADAAARAGSPAEDAADLVPADGSSPTGTTPPVPTDIHVFDRFAPGARRGLRPGRRRAAGPLRLRLPRAHHDLPRLLDRAAAAPRPADRSLGLHRQGRRPHPQRLGGRRDPRLRRRRRPRRWRPTLAERLGWAERQVDLPAGRYDTILPPDGGGRPDDRRLLVRRRARRPRRPVGLQPPRRRHPDRRAGRPARAYDSSPTRRHPGLECEPFVTASTSSNEQSVFDNGLPLGRARLDRRRHPRRR